MLMFLTSTSSNKRRGSFFYPASIYYISAFTPALEKSKSAKEMLKITVFWPHDNHGGQTLAGVDLDFHDHPLQPNDGAGENTF